MHFTYLRYILKISIVFLIALCQISEANSNYSYTIITTSEINNTSAKLPDFVSHKQALGFNVQVITEADFGGGTGDEAAENIRTWLQANYIAYNIEYVLLIGNPDPNLGEVPMKMLWPEILCSTPSDIYYADLTGNWDLDQDSHYGEWEDDVGTGGIDREWEVLVGRIPHYPDYDEPNDLDKILSRMIHYEEQDGEQILWRKNVLLAMNRISDDTHDPGPCILGESIKNDILEPAEWRWHRLYREETLEDCDCMTPPEDIIPSGVCDYLQLPEIWGAGKFGMVVWRAHGGYEAASCLIRIEDVRKLNDNYPSFTFQEGCSTAEPERYNNLAYILLRDAAVCTIGATRSTNPSSMAYGYILRLVAGFTSGEALYGYKQHTVPVAQSNWNHFVLYNIYGDPSLRLVFPRGRILYVDSNAPSGGDGLSWPSAFNHLQDALAAALPADEIHISQGTYIPDRDAAHPLGTGARIATFRLKNGVTIMGGYAGLSTPDPNTRNTNVYKTILSGDLNNNDGLALTNCDENSYHVVTAPRATCETTIIDGVTITGGNADSNDANSHGGGIYGDHAYIMLVDCNLTTNYATHSGGGIYNYRGGSTLINCRFSSNKAGKYGGAMYIDYCNDSLTNCILSGNSAKYYGGAIWNSRSNVKLKNCTIATNSALLSGGIHNDGSNVLVTNSIFYDNENEQIHAVDSKTNIIYSNIQGGWPGETNIKTDPMFADLNNIDPNKRDYHLKSQAGRYDPNSGNWVIDNVTSLCIDAGDPNSPVGDEPGPNGDRINMGAYGGTAEASLSP